MNENNAMRFVYAFLDFVDNQGIYDEFDPEENCMVTSDEMIDLITMAETIVPERLSNEEAAASMRELTPAERDYLIDQDEGIIDLRNHFAEQMALNGGARGLLEKLTKANGPKELQELLEMASEFNEKENNVPQT